MTTFDCVYLTPTKQVDTCLTCGGDGQVPCWTDFVNYTTGARGEIVVTCPNCGGCGDVEYHYVGIAYYGSRSLPITLETYEAWLDSLGGDDDIQYLAHVYENSGSLLPQFAY